MQMDEGILEATLPMGDPVQSESDLHPEMWPCNRKESLLAGEEATRRCLSS